mmetsp:Transcript_563/g.993  ORF Transcript_563/g.993 Transcript_563/m.993 type:complete len:480 (-) Transcript_563:194-1633(-)|eukprot:CAMPEP_0177777184 /NCGR_PEP_ID=MMETSP0491_2-20121128/15179_1 /TAXON_ID=63592 /ORGANISM="Tetraselmis chuii, Strain PLY429" /LENGTH=479 /DNA_ID=CAMNT_0019296161 /DNA_START=354 /DNA_END=1793 /DNA_ORIENTATION=-
MPPSVTGYGHTGGINVQNKRALTGRRGGECINAHDWKNNTVEELCLADRTKIMSHTSRMHAKNLQDMSTEQLQKDSDLLHEALSSKLNKTEAMAGLLNQTAEKVETEIASLERNRKRLLSLIRQTEKKIQVNEERLRTRAMRPARELVSDDVQGQLQSTATMLKGTMDKLHRCLKSTEIDISRLSESKLALQMDLTNKHGAMTVDTQVLNDDQGQMINAKGAIRKSTMYAHTWTKNTEEVVRTANQWQHDAHRLRVAIGNVCEDIRHNERTLRNSLHVSAIGKLAETQQLKHVLQQQHAELQMELEEAKVAHGRLDAQLSELETAIAKTKQQYMHRTQRPDPEKVVDEVESALLKTLTNQKAMRSSMLERRSGVATKISSLETTLAKLDANINDKDLCMALDSKALMLDGRSSPSRAPSEASLAVTGSVARSRSAASGRSSTRESIMSRLSQLEDDLRKTRESNEALERGIQDYQSSQY